MESFKKVGRAGGTTIKWGEQQLILHRTGYTHNGTEKCNKQNRYGVF